MIFTWCVTCLFMLQTLQGKGCLFHMCKDALDPNQSLWIQILENSLKEGHLSDTAPAWRQHNKLEATKMRLKRKDCNTGHWHQSLGILQSTQGKQRDLGQFWGQRLPWALTVKQLQSLGASKPSSGLQYCWMGPWSLKTLNHQPGLTE